MSSEDKSDGRLEARKAEVERKVHAYVDLTLHQMRAASVSQSMELINGLQYMNEKDIDGWESFVADRLPANIASAERLYNTELVGNLRTLQHEKVISLETVQFWLDKFRDTSVDYKTKETFVEKELIGRRMPEWRAAKRERDELCRDPRVQALTSMEYAGIDAFRNEDAFASLSFRAKKDAVSRVKAVLEAQRSNMFRKHEQVRGELEALAHGNQRVLHPLKVGGWMERVFAYAKTPQQADAYMKATVRPFVQNWRRVRGEFDEVDAKLAKAESSPFRRLTVDQFLLLPFDQRENYVGRARAALADPTIVRNDAEALKKVPILLSAARAAMANEKFDEAKDALDEAATIDPLNFAVRSLKMQVDAKTQELNEEPDEVLEDLRTIVGRLPHTLQQQEYAAVLERGPQQAITYFTLLETGIDLTEKFEVTEEEEVTHREEIDREVHGEDEDEVQVDEIETVEDEDEEATTESPVLPQAKRTEEEPTVEEEEEGVYAVETESAQVLYADPRRANAIVDSVEQLSRHGGLSESQRIGYIPDEISLEHRKTAVAYHQTIVQGLTALERKGVAFSRARKTTAQAA